jgi:uncharacterized protein
MQAIDFLAGQSDGRCTVTFFGGEPLLELPLLKQVVDFAQLNYRAKINFRMSTNGTMLNREILDYFLQHDIYFALSIDGSKTQHDMLRHTANGRGSYDAIMQKLPDVLEFNPYTIAVSVIVPETTKYLADGAINLFAKGFRYVLQTLDYSAKWSSRDMKVLKEQYQRLAKYYGESLKEGNKIYYSPFDQRINTHADKPYGKGDICDLANTQIAIAPSGRIYPCVQFVGTDDGKFVENSIGDVFRGFDTGRRKYFIEENYAEKEPCPSCALNGRCAVYCGCVNWRATGSLRIFPPVICEHERMLMPIVDSMANDLWAKNVELFRRKFYEKTFAASSYIEDCWLKRGRKDA